MSDNQAFGLILAWLVTAILVLSVALFILARRKDCITEINVIWFAFSFTFLIWFSLNLVFRVNSFVQPDFVPNELKLWIFRNVHAGLTDAETELVLVGAVIFVAVAPQLLTHLFAGFFGVATTPKLVWQFEKFAIWSLIKFLAVAGGVWVADGVSVRSGFDPEHLESFLSGLTAVALAFVITVMQVYFVEFAHKLGEAWKQDPKSLQYRVHRYFTRNIPLEVKEASSGDGIIGAALAMELRRRYPSLSQEDASRMARAYIARASKLFAAIY